MHEYEIIIEEITPCGGEKYAKRTIVEAEAESPRAYAEADGLYPIMDIIEKPDGSTVVITGNGKGNIVRFTFSE